MIALLLMVLGCTTEPPRQSVLLLTISGVRADRVGAYGYNPSDTPHLDALAGKGTKFTRAYATSTDAGAALVSIMTGQSPPAHGRRTSNQRGVYSAGSDIQHRGSTSRRPGGGLVLHVPGLIPDKIEVEDEPSSMTVFERLTRSKRKTGLGFLTTLAEHGYGVDSVSLMDFPEVTPLRRFRDEVMEKWSIKWTVHEADSIEAWVVHFPPLAEDAGRTMSVTEYDEALREYDRYIGELLDEWSAFRPDGYVVVTGVNGSLNGAREEASLGLTDDLLRVPLVVSGPGVEADWVVSSVVSTVDIATTITDFLDVPFEGTGENLMSGGSTLAYHESPYAYERFNARPVVGYTDESGRYVEGVYGRWFPASKGQVLVFEMPMSEYPEQAKTLQELRTSIGTDKGLPAEAWTLQLDAADCVRFDSLANKLERTISRGRMAAADRMLDRLTKEAPDARIVQALSNKLAAAQAESKAAEAK